MSISGKEVIDINQQIKVFYDTPGAFLVDVRMMDEHARGYIPGSMNVPFNQLRTFEEKVPDKSAPVFVYCHSGSRSSRAAKLLEILGYTNVTDLGGINDYTGLKEYK